MNQLQEQISAVLTDRGLSRTELEKFLPTVGAKRLTRELRAMAAAGLIRFEGQTKARRYFSPQPASIIPLSQGARDALALVETPQEQRRPVSYARAFLDSYAPNETHWLAPGLKAHLSRVGATPAQNQPAGTYARRVLERFLLELSWNSARLEGNTYSLLDTRKLLEVGATAEGATALETQMLLNHKAAIEFMVAEQVPELNARTTQNLHALLLDNLLSSFHCGRLRSTAVAIGASVYLPLNNPQLIEECFRQIILTARAITDAFERSFFLLVQLPYLQPFLDGNKRTARLVANLPFIHENLVPLSFTDIPRELFNKAYLAVYERQRIEPLRDVFAWAYERSAARLGQVQSSVGEPDPFRLKYRDILREAVAAVVREGRSSSDAERRLEEFVNTQVESRDRLRVLAMVHTELAQLHEGNFARYGLRPSEFDAWPGMN